MNFCSDNTTGAAPEILEAIVRLNDGQKMPYGNDDITAEAETRIQEIFETECPVFLLATGTAANALALSTMTPPYGAIYCHAHSHVHVDECGAPELFSGGAKLVPLAGRDAKITAVELAGDLAKPRRGVHQVQPAAVSIAQASEGGTLYSRGEVEAIAGVCQNHGLGLHMDGARFANAVAALGCAPADITWRAGVDALSFGASKNGAIAAEAVVFFNHGLAESFAFRRKRAGHLFSKSRFLGAQFLAYLENGLWLKNARHANAMAARLASGLGAVAGAQFNHPVQANELFVSLPEGAIRALEDAGFLFYRWGGAQSTLLRLVCAFNTDAGDVERFIEIAAAA